MMKAAPLTFALLLAPMPLLAARDKPVPVAPAADPLEAYVHGLAADDRGDLQASAVDFARAFGADPGNSLLALRTYRQALNAGEFPLAIATAQRLRAGHLLPPDGTLLLLGDAVRRHKWDQADALAGEVTNEKLFAFLVPVVRAWIAYGRHADPFAPLAETKQAGPLAVPYASEHRALLLLATGRLDEGVAAITALGTPDSGRAARLRIAAAALLQARHKREAAMALLTGSDAAIQRARASLAAGRRLPGAINDPTSGVAELFARVGADLNHADTAPLAVGFARIATMLAPGDSESWLILTSLLAHNGDGTAALAAVGHVAPDDPFIGLARDAQVRLLEELDRPADALAEAQAAVSGPTVLAEDWSRLGDVLTQSKEYRPAADAYARALTADTAEQAPAAKRWPLLVERANALIQAGDWPGARADAQAALALAPDQPAVLNFLGYSELERGQDVAAAAAMIAKAASLAPKDPAITDSLGWSWYVRGDLAKAVPLLEQAAREAPAEADIQEHLGDAYWAAGRHLEARYAWHAALVVADADDAARLRTKIEDGPAAPPRR